MSTSIGRATRLALLAAIAGALQAQAPAFAGETSTADVGAAYRLVHVFDLAQGSIPRGLLQASDGNLYGVTSSGGQFDGGTFYRLSSNGEFTVLHEFGSPGAHDGIQPVGGLVEASDGNLYGVAVKGGTANGIVYRMSLGGDYTVLYRFGKKPDCANPIASLVQAPDGNLYGTTLHGGNSAIGCVYRLSLDGSYAVVYSFTWHDGYFTEAPLIVGQDGLLYGTAEYGGRPGRSGQGAIFRVSTDGVYEVIHAFRGTDGSYPYGPLVQEPDGSFYGTTGMGGASDSGTVFRLAPDGSLKTLHSFPAYGTNADGRYPYTGLLDGGDGFLYGTTGRGGDPSCGCGTVFRIAPDGTNEAVIHTFTSSAPGESPSIGNALIRSQDGHLLGAAQGNGGGSSVTGTIYGLSEPMP